MEHKSIFKITREGLEKVQGHLQKSKEDNNNIDFTNPQTFERYYKNAPSIYTGLAYNYFLKTKDSAGNSLLHAAAFLGKEKEIEHILSCAFTKNQKAQLVSAINSEGEDALHFYFKYVGLNNKKYLADLKDQQNNNQNENIQIADYKYQIFEILLEYVPDLSRLVKGNTYLMYALNEQATEKLCWLICNTAKSATYVTEHLTTKKVLTITKPLDLNVKNRDITAYRLAANLGYHDLMRALPAITSYESIGFLTKVDNPEANTSFGLMKSMVLALNAQALTKYLKEQPKRLGIDLLGRLDKETERTLLGILANTPVSEENVDKIEAVAKVLCGSGAPVDYATQGMPTPLFDAVLGGNTKLANYLKKDKNASVTGADKQWNNIMHTAVLSKNESMVKLVLTWFLSDPVLRDSFRTIVKTPNQDGRTPLGLSIEQGTFAISTRIIHAYQNCGNVSMEQVPVDSEEDETIISVLNLQDSAGNNYLLQAIVNNDLAGFKFALSQKNKDLFKTPNNEGKTYLHVIFEMKLFSFLRDDKTKKDVLTAEQVATYVVPFFAAKDNSGNIPFHYLLSHATSGEEHSKIEEMFWTWWLLANHGEDNDLLAIKNNEGRTILHELCAHGYKNSLNKLLATPTVLVAHTDVQDNNGFTPLHQAVMSGENEMVLMFLQHPERVSLKLDKEGYSFFHRIVMNRNVELWKAALDKLQGMDILDQLMKLTTRSEQQTVLHLIMADKEKGEEFFNILVEKTGDNFIHNLSDSRGTPPIHNAIKQNLLAIVRYFKMNHPSKIYSAGYELHFPILQQYEAMFNLMLESIPEGSKDRVLNFVLDGFTPLMRALQHTPDIQGGVPPMVKKLAEHAQVVKFNPNTFNGNDELGTNICFDTILHVAACYGEDKFKLVRTNIMSAVENGTAPVIFSAIMMFLWPNYEMRRTPFFKAAEHGNKDVFSYMDSTLQGLIIKFLEKGAKIPESATHHPQIVNFLKGCAKIFTQSGHQDTNDREWVNGEVFAKITKLLYEFIFLQMKDKDGRNCIQHAIVSGQYQMFLHLLQLLFVSKETQELVVPEFLNFMNMTDGSKKIALHLASRKAALTPQSFFYMFEHVELVDKNLLKAMMQKLDDDNNSSLEYLVQYGNMDAQLLCAFSDSDDKSEQGILQRLGMSMREALFWAAEKKQQHLFGFLWHNCTDELAVELIVPLLQLMLKVDNGLGIDAILNSIVARTRLKEYLIDPNGDLADQLNRMLWPLYLHQEPQMKNCVDSIILLLAGKTMTLEFYAAAYDANLLRAYLEHFNYKVKDVSSIFNSEGQTLIQTAVAHGNDAAAQFLMETFAPKRTERVRKWLLHKDDYTRSLVFYAIQSFNPWILQRLKDLNINYPLEVNKDTNTTLIQLWAGCFDAGKVGAVRKIGEILFEKFPDTINQGTRSGETPMHRAASARNWVALELLLSPPQGIKGASVFCLNAEFYTPLHFIIRNNDVKSAEIFMVAAYKQFPDLCSKHDDVSELLQEVTVYSKKMQAFPALSNDLRFAMNEQLAQLKQQPAAQLQEESDDESQYSEESETSVEKGQETTCGLM